MEQPLFLSSIKETRFFGCILLYSWNCCEKKRYNVFRIYADTTILFFQYRRAIDLKKLAISLSSAVIS